MPTLAASLYGFYQSILIIMLTRLSVQRDAACTTAYTPSGHLGHRTAPLRFHSASTATATDAEQGALPTSKVWLGGDTGYRANPSTPSHAPGQPRTLHLPDLPQIGARFEGIVRLDEGGPGVSQHSSLPSSRLLLLGLRDCRRNLVSSMYRGFQAHPSW